MTAVHCRAALFEASHASNSHCHCRDRARAPASDQSRFRPTLSAQHHPEAGALRRLIDQCRFSKGLHREALSAPLPFWGSHAFLLAGDGHGRRKGVLP
jgi:hypothetical protein